VASLLEKKSISLIDMCFFFFSFFHHKRQLYFVKFYDKKSLVLFTLIMYTSYLHIIIEEVTKVVQVNASHL
jgi:uncharacterized membrane protein